LKRWWLRALACIVIILLVTGFLLTNPLAEEAMRTLIRLELIMRIIFGGVISMTASTSKTLLRKSKS